MAKAFKLIFYVLISIFVAFLVAGFLGVVADNFLSADLTDGSIDGEPDTLGWLGLGVGFIALFSLVAIGAVTIWTTSSLYKFFQNRRALKQDKGLQNKSNKNKRTRTYLVLALVSIALWIAMAIVKTSSNENGLSSSEKSTERMPNLISSYLSDAQQKLDQLDVDLSVRTIDLLRSRSVWDDENWTVVSQSPAAGALLSKKSDVCIGIVKNDETWKTHRQLQCWSEAKTELDLIDNNYQLKLKDLLTLTSLPSSLNGYHLRATVKIEMDGGNTVYLPYCTYSTYSANSEINLKLDASDGGDPGVFADGGQSFKAGLFLNWIGRYRYTITKLEKSQTSKCG